MLFALEERRLRVSKGTEAVRKSQFGQFLTPAKTARFMAGMFGIRRQDTCRLLDAGAGIGSLSAAFLERWSNGGFDFQRVEVDAFEIDDRLHTDLFQALANPWHHLDFSLTIRKGDFVHDAVDSLSGSLFVAPLHKYTHAILNPPYKKIKSNSAYRSALRRVGIETVNLYSAFVSLSLSLLEKHGQLVAITPRSFCNGPYYRPFREFVFSHAAIKHLHLFASRDKAFKDDDVLQENVIILLERGAKQGEVKVTTSTDDSFSDLVTHHYPFEQIVSPGDPELFIHVPTSPILSACGKSGHIQHTLNDLGLKVSTGPVVDFRLRDYLREMPSADSVPLIYPTHFSGRGVEWPKLGIKKPNAIERNTNTEKWLYPTGYYCVVRRFSSKEENHRVVACVVDPAKLHNAPMLGFENHLNIFHDNKGGLSPSLANGLAVYLSTTVVDDNFRRFSGHTQVNATDLKLMKYPSRDLLCRLGEWAMKSGELTQEMIDEKFGEMTA